MRIGGLDQTRSTNRSGGTSSGVHVCTCTPSSRALARVSSRARSFVSTAQTVALGSASASAHAIGPQPQPTSTWVKPPVGGSLWRSNTSVALSRRSPENTPEDVRNSRSEEHTSELQSRGHLVCRLLLEKK